MISPYALTMPLVLIIGLTSLIRTVLWGVRNEQLTVLKRRRCVYDPEQAKRDHRARQLAG